MMEEKETHTKDEVYRSVLKRSNELLKTSFDTPSNRDTAFARAICEEIYEIKKAFSKHMSINHGQANYYED